MTTSVFENEKKLKQGTKFEKKETKGDLFRKQTKDAIKNKAFTKGKGEIPKGKMLEADNESLREEFQNRYGKKLKSGGRVNLRGGGICKKGMNKKAYGANS
jgi:hypothetical protein